MEVSLRTALVRSKTWDRKRRQMIAASKKLSPTERNLLETHVLWSQLTFIIRGSFNRLTRKWSMTTNDIRRFVDILDFYVELFVSCNRNETIILKIEQLTKLGTNCATFDSSLITYQKCLDIVKKKVYAFNDRHHFLFNKMASLVSNPPLLFTEEIKAWIVNYLFLSYLIME